MTFSWAMTAIGNASFLGDKIGIITWVGIMVGLIAKAVLAFIMVGIFWRGLAVLKRKGASRPGE
jgi:hypothetical protein